MNIQGMKIGNTVNFSINGKLRKQTFSNPEEATELFNAILVAKNNPTDENVKMIETLYSMNMRVALYAGLEADENGNVFLKGFNTPIPNTLIKVFKEYHENNYPMDALKNFWKLLMLQPDERVREKLFDFIEAHDFSITDNGYMITYKAVYVKENKNNNKLLEFIKEQHYKVKHNWKTNPSRYVVLNEKGTFEFQITKEETYNGWNENKLSKYSLLGNLNTMYNATEYHIENTIYTDMHTKSMNIEIGKPVYMDRKDCDSNPEIDCSYGLHVGATSYVEKFANHNSKILICLVNPANVVAVPNYNHSKMRVSEYYPIGVANYSNKKIEIIEQPYFENDYTTYEEKELKEMLNKVKQNQKPFETAIHAEEESRSMSELIKILESRLVDIE